MNDSNNIEARIEAYLLGELNPEDRTQFENEISNSAEMRKEVELQKAAYAASQLYSESLLKGEMNSWDSSRGRTVKLFPLLAAAALVAGLIFGLWKLSEPARTATPQELFAQHYEVYRPPILVRGDDTTQTLFKAASEHYASGEFDKSAEMFEAYLVEQDDIEARLYAGLSHLSDNPPKSAEAITHLKVAANAETPFQEQSQWYLALAHLHGSNTAVSMELLSRIANSESHYKKVAAKRLLKQIK